MGGVGVIFDQLAQLPNLVLHRGQLIFRPLVEPKLSGICGAGHLVEVVRHADQLNQVLFELLCSKLFF